jgi:hypothetical protein
MECFMSIDDNLEPQENVPYEDHIIPTNGDGLLSGLFDMVGEITKDAVGLTNASATDVQQLAHEIADMAGIDVSPQDQQKLDRQAWAEEQRQQFMEHKLQTKDRGLDMGR